MISGGKPLRSTRSLSVLLTRPLTRLLTLYQTLFDAIHAKSGQERTLKLQYVRTSQESVMGWVCPILLSYRLIVG